LVMVCGLKYKGQERESNKSSQQWLSWHTKLKLGNLTKGSEA
jgi:hypothetical protein